MYEVEGSHAIVSKGDEHSTHTFGSVSLLFGSTHITFSLMRHLVRFFVTKRGLYKFRFSSAGAEYIVAHYCVCHLCVLRAQANNIRKRCNREGELCAYIPSTCLYLRFRFERSTYRNDWTGTLTGCLVITKQLNCRLLLGGPDAKMCGTF